MTHLTVKVPILVVIWLKLGTLAGSYAVSWMPAMVCWGSKPLKKESVAQRH